jgi:hypothetical protein
MPPDWDGAWWENRENILQLAFYMASIGSNGWEVAYMIEKPWNYREEWKRYLMSDAFGGAG